MIQGKTQRWILGIALPAVLGGMSSCGSSTKGISNGGRPVGSDCAANIECASGLCQSGTCATALTTGQPCASGADCTSGVCLAGICGSATNLPGGTTCTANTECASGLCLGGSCASGQPAAGPCGTGADCASGVCQSGACVGSGKGAPAGSSCSANTDCASGSCVNGVCGSGSALPDGSSCSSATECASSACTNGICGVVLRGQPNGASCAAGSDCSSGLCVNGVCTSPTTGGSTTTTVNGTPITTTTGAQWNGSGSGYRPMIAGCGPDTATQCTGTCEQSGGDPNATIIRPPATLCFSSPDDPSPSDPAAVIEQSIETLNGVTYAHVRITFDPSFVDNVYGTDSNRSDSGWGQKGGIHIYNHAFDPDLVKSDHAELLMTDATGATIIDFNLDYISVDPAESCGYGSLGVTGGDGSVVYGDPTKVLATTTSLERNLDGCGYCTSTACGPSGSCTVDSPTTDASYTANPLTPNWDYRVVYETWVDVSAFGSAGFGQAYMTYVHASPNKSTLVSLNITPTPCPPLWDTPYCPPSVISEGAGCFGSPGGGAGGAGGSTSVPDAGLGGSGATAGAGGTAGSTSTGGAAGSMSNGGSTSTGGAGGSMSTGGAGGSGGSPGTCPVNYQIYITSEGQSTCTPIPFANYPGMTACPTGYHLDLASEGRYCLPN